MPPADLDAAIVAEAVATDWGLPLNGLHYVPLGGGSHHWAALAPDGAMYFVTVDDLLDKPWLGTDRESAFRGLRGTLGTARHLRDGVGLPFVLGPISSLNGDAIRRLTPRYSLTVFPFVSGQTGRWGDDLPPEDRDRILRMLAELHEATPAVRSLAWRRDSEVYERADLETALGELDQPWDGGPFAESARRAIAAQIGAVSGWLADFDQLAAHVAASAYRLVLTHGEPHGGNIIRTGEEFLLIDWDTVALAPPERDLWMLDDGTATALAAYTDVTGRTADAVTIGYYRLAWRLADLAACTRVLKSPHQRDGNTERAWASLQIVLDQGPTGWNGPYRHVPAPR